MINTLSLTKNSANPDACAQKLQYYAFFNGLGNISPKMAKDIHSGENTGALFKSLAGGYFSMVENQMPAKAPVRIMLIAAKALAITLQ